MQVICLDHYIILSVRIARRDAERVVVTDQAVISRAQFPIFLSVYFLPYIIGDARSREELLLFPYICMKHFVYFIQKIFNYL